MSELFALRNDNRARKEGHDGGAENRAVQPVRRGTRAAIIIIFTSPRVIKAARYTCFVRGHPLPTARTTPLGGAVGVVAARGRVGYSREGAQRRNGEGRARAVFSGVAARRGETDGGTETERVRGRDAAVKSEEGGGGGGGVVFTRHGCWCCCCCCCFCWRPGPPFFVYCCPIERTDDEPVFKPRARTNILVQPCFPFFRGEGGRSLNKTGCYWSIAVTHARGALRSVNAVCIVSPI